MFVFKNAYRAPPGYMLYKDKNTGEIMYVHHRDVDKFEEQERAEGKKIKNTKRDSYYGNTPIYDSPSQRNHSNNLSRSNNQSQGDETRYNPWAQERQQRQKPTARDPSHNRPTRSDLNDYTNPNKTVPTGRGPFMANHDVGETLRRNTN
jgi:hypothetical protein